jgi:hypothetical protein
MKQTTPLHGYLVEFDTPEDILRATRAAWKAGYRQMDAYTPYPVEGLPTELGLQRTGVPLLVLIAGLAGAAAGFFMQYWTMAVNYPFNSGGRPPNSWPVFIPATFEMMILISSFAAGLGMLFLNGLPRLYHPVFKVDRFTEHSHDRYFLCIEATDPRFDLEATRVFLASLQSPREVMEVPH